MKNADKSGGSFKNVGKGGKVEKKLRFADTTANNFM